MVPNGRQITVKSKFKMEQAWKTLVSEEWGVMKSKNKRMTGQEKASFAIKGKESPLKMRSSLQPNN